ncbi:hypothetical protein SAMN04488116_2605 [Flagellimonas flava]|uniref:Uncharacterized protein n=1 Tax=Flagellimonas flava TaxID=570519 RepID=A0A1M5N182_9FLAO|nr:hypothetical protein SAMN04488116_2605 [Allomuricauda flava]
MLFFASQNALSLDLQLFLVNLHFTKDWKDGKPLTLHLITPISSQQ